MSELLTKAEYEALAARLDFPRAAFIDGKFRAGQGMALPTLNPATGEKLCDIAACNAADVDLAVEKARDAFDQGHWSKMHPAERKTILIRLAKLMTRNQRELAVLESLESGKPIRDCVGVDIPEAINCIKWHAEAIDKIYDQTAPVGDEALSLIVREPIGVVAAVLPWNFPLLMLAWKLGPALASGCSLLVKPAEQTSMTALKVAELAREAGVPSGVLQVLPGSGPDVGEPLGRHMQVDMVTFTGSTETGCRFLTYAGESNLKKVVLECGGKNPAIVFADAENLDAVAAHVANAAFWNMGENCSACSRLIVEAPIKEALVERLIAHMKKWRVGDPLDPKNDLGALIDKEHCAKVVSYMDGKPLAGGKVEGPYVQPTLFEGRADEPRAREEIFGPVLTLLTAATADEAVAMANDTDYGLAVSLFTASNRKGLRAARDLKAGTVTLNCYGEGDATTPFGGYKQSGFGGRDKGLHAHDQYCEIKTIWIDLSDPEDGDHHL